MEIIDNTNTIETDLTSCEVFLKIIYLSPHPPTVTQPPSKVVAPFVATGEFGLFISDFFNSTKRKCNTAISVFVIILPVTV